MKNIIVFIIFLYICGCSVNQPSVYQSPKEDNFTLWLVKEQQLIIDDTRSYIDCVYNINPDSQVFDTEIQNCIDKVNKRFK